MAVGDDYHISDRGNSGQGTADPDQAVGRSVPGWRESDTADNIALFLTLCLFQRGENQSYLCCINVYFEDGII